MAANPGRPPPLRPASRFKGIYQGEMSAFARCDPFRQSLPPSDCRSRRSFRRLLSKSAIRSQRRNLAVTYFAPELLPPPSVREEEKGWQDQGKTHQPSRVTPPCGGTGGI